MTAPDKVPCACGCGTLVNPSARSRDGLSWARGHAIRGPGGYRPPIPPLPGDDSDDGELTETLVDDAELDYPESFSEAYRAAAAPDDDGPDWLAPAPERPARPTVRIGTGGRDPKPGHLGRGRGGRGKLEPPRPRPGPVTATIRKDVKAKIRIVTLPGARLWQARDGYCGGRAVDAEPDIADALADIVCDSPELLHWFTGPGGGYMTWFKLAMACGPVAGAVFNHHVLHGTAAAARPDPNQPPQHAAVPFAA